MGDGILVLVVRVGGVGDVGAAGTCLAVGDGILVLVVRIGGVGALGGHGAMLLDTCPMTITSSSPASSAPTSAAM